MVANTEVADVLEWAADLYESEQIDWCRGAWGRTERNQKEGQFHCAEGALLRAAGFDMNMILDGQGMDPPGAYVNVNTLLSTPVVLAAMDAVNKQLGREVGRLYHYNDQLNEHTAKQQLIETFKETAKELRNGS